MNEKKYLWHLKCKFHREEFYEMYKTFWGMTKIDGEYYSWRITSKGHDFINHHFYECTQVYEYTMTKEWFTSYLKEEPNRYHDPNRKHRVYHWRWARRAKARESNNHFVRGPWHVKKVISEHEQSRRDWREKKGVAKDKSKAYYRRGAGQYWKQLCNQSHRAWSKQNIKKHQTAEMSDTDYKLFLDPWRWD